MLLHIGGFQTVMLPKLLELLRAAEASASSRCRKRRATRSTPSIPTRPLPTGVTLLDQMRVAKAIPDSAPPDDTFASLAAACR